MLGSDLKGCDESSWTRVRCDLVSFHHHRPERTPDLSRSSLLKESLMLMAMSNNDPFHYLNASQQPSRSLWQYSFALPAQSVQTHNKNTAQWVFEFKIHIVKGPILDLRCNIIIGVIFGLNYDFRNKATQSALRISEREHKKQTLFKNKRERNKLKQELKHYLKIFKIIK